MEQWALERIAAEQQAKRYNRDQLAKAAGVGNNRVTEALNGKAGGPPRAPYWLIEAAGRLTGKDPAEYVADPKSEVRVLSPAEAEFLRYARDWPGQVFLALLTFARHFATHTAAEQTYRNAVSYLRHMTKPRRELAIANLLVKSEEGLSADERAALARKATPLASPAEPHRPPADSLDAIVKGVPPNTLGIAEARKLLVDARRIHRQALKKQRQREAR